MHMIETNLARQIARKANMFARLSAGEAHLVFYTGDESAPGTWLEAGRTMIDRTRGGCLMVARNAVELITRCVS